MNGSAEGGTHALFGLPDSDDLVDPDRSQLSTITTPGDVRHYVRGRYLDVPWAERREVWCLIEPGDQTLERRARKSA